MATKLADKFANLTCEIKEIEKELILEMVEKVTATEQKIKKWEILGRKILTKWDKVSAIDEISQQRGKSW
ncbi:MAG: hypothetical protein ABH886_07210 [Candidatus Desantisbacteria bacterium]